MATDAFSDEELGDIERDHPDGLSSEQILALFVGKGAKLTEATLRKYVQLGLLPRSRRVALDDKQRGSKGLYPATVVRRIQRLRVLMTEFTIEQIQREFLFVRADVEELERTLERIFSALGAAVKAPREGAGEPSTRAALRELSEARALAADLMAKISSVETRLTMQARLRREAV